jgi:hypothetical protein
MSKEKQIDQKQVVQMARDICCKRDKPQNCKDCNEMWCKAHLHAFRAYKAGYRKQEEGEWEKSEIPGEEYVCSVCGGACWYYDVEGYVAKSRFCPNCGARMKGGAE